MRYLICSRGHSDDLPYIDTLIRNNIGVELQSYGQEGIRSEKEWNRRVEMHMEYRKRYDGYLAVHGPFIGLQYCHYDHILRTAVQKRMMKTYRTAVILNADLIVFHSGLTGDVDRFGIMDEWLERTIRFWRKEIIRYADAGITVCLENILDETPDFLQAVHDGVDHPNLKLCLDTGHVNVWSVVGLETWFCTLGSRIAHVHLHNNDGKRDQHNDPDFGTLNLRDELSRMAGRIPGANISLEVSGPPDLLIRRILEIQRIVTG